MTMLTWKDFKGSELSAVLFILLSYFVYKEFTSDDCQDLRNALKTSEARVEKLEDEKTNLTRAIFVKNGVIDAILQTVDSTARVKLPPEGIKNSKQ